jgi:hypothetical protein
MAHLYWTLSQAVTWIAFRSEQAVAGAPLTLVELLLVNGSNEAVRKAVPELWAALSVGALKATGIGSGGEAARRSEISAKDWQDLQPFLKTAGSSSAEQFHRPGYAPGETFTEVTVGRADVMKAWRATPPTGKRGPKNKVDPVEFTRVVHQWIAHNGIPDPKLDPRERQADLEKHMMRWHGDKIGVARNRQLVTIAIACYKADNSSD